MSFFEIFQSAIWNLAFTLLPPLAPFIEETFPDFAARLPSSTRERFFNEAPSITSAATATVAENTTAVTTVTATDPDVSDTVTFSIVDNDGADDGALFAIDATTGALTFQSAPDFENPTDVGGTPSDGVYEVEVEASDGSLSDRQVIAVTVTGGNEAPSITSAATATVAENTTAVTTVTATDPDVSDTVTFSIVDNDGADDGALFAIDATTGALTFQSAPDFENPADVGGTPSDGVYEVEVEASDGSLSDRQVIAVTVTGGNEAPSITSAATATVAENTTAVTTVTATDPDVSDTVTFSIVDNDGADDGALFAIDATTGALTFQSAPDFENPTDVGGTPSDGVYEVEVEASDGSLSDRQVIAVTVTGGNEAPSITSAATATVAENTTAVTTVTATDPDVSDTVTFSIVDNDGADDGALFAIDATTGALTFQSAPDFENPADVGGTPSDGVYEVEVEASDGSLSDRQVIAVTVTGGNEAPSITSAATATVAENTTAVTTVTATDPDVSDTVTFSIVDNDGADDGALFAIDATTGALTFQSAPDFENPTDVGGTPSDGVYEVEVEASDGSLSDSQVIAVTVTDGNEAPSNLDLSANKAPENVPGARIGELSASDPDSGDGRLTYSIRPGPDAGFFTVDGDELRVGDAALDFEARASFSIVVRATDAAGAFVDRTFTIEVRDSEEYSLTTGTDVISADPSDAQVIGNPLTLNTSDDLDGGDGTDELVLFGSGTFDLRTLAGFQNFEEVRVVNSSSSSVTLYPRAGTTTSVVLDTSWYAYVDLRNSGQVSSLRGGDGSDGLRVYNADGWNPSIVFDGGAGNDTIWFYTSGTFDLRAATLTSVENIYVYSSATVQVDDDTLTDVKYIYGNSGNRVLTDETALDLTGVRVNSVLVESTNTTGTTFMVDRKDTAFQIAGGSGPDTLLATGLTFTETERSFIFGTQSIETIVDSSGTFNRPPANPADETLTAGPDNLTLGDADNSVIGNPSTLNTSDDLDGGDGTDELVLFGSGTFDLRTLAGFQNFEEVRVVNPSNSSVTLYPRAGTTTSVVLDTTSTAYVNLYNSGQVSSLLGGDGSDGLRVYNADGWNPDIVFDGGDGYDSIEFRTSGTFDLRAATLTSVETIYVYNRAVVQVDDDTLADVTYISGSSVGRVITDETALDLSGVRVNSVVVESTNTTGTTFMVDRKDTAFQIAGGNGTDTLLATGLTFTETERSFIFGAQSIETIVDSSGTFNRPPANPADETLTAGPDNLTLGDADNTVIGNPSTLNTSDDLDGGDGTDELVLFGGGTFDLHALAGFQNFEEVRVVNPSNSSVTLYPRAGTTTSVVLDTTSTAYVNLYNSGQVSSLLGGDGYDRLWVANPDGWNPDIVFDGGDGYDSIEFRTSGTFDLRAATLTSVEYIYVYSFATVQLDDDTLTDVTRISGTSGNRVLTDETALDLTGVRLNSVLVESTNTTGTTFMVDQKDTAFQIAGGNGTDTLLATGLTFTETERSALFSQSSIEVIVDDTGIYGNNDANALTGTSGNDVIIGNGGDDTIAGGEGYDFATGGSGADVFVIADVADTTTIVDFAGGSGVGDKIDVSDFGFASKADVLALATQDDEDTRLALDADTALVLLNVERSTLNPDDFIILG